VAKIVIASIGSFGDIFPILPIADRLRSHGHDLHFVVPTEHLAAVQAEGFHARGFQLPPGPSLNESVAPRDVRARIQSRLPEIVARTIELLEPACAGADLMLTHPSQLAATLVATKLGIKWVTLTPYPGNIPSAYTVPQPHWLPALPTAAGRLLNRATWRVFQFGFEHLSQDTIRETLDRAGITPQPEHFTAGGLSPYLVLVLSSPMYSPPPPDWPPHVKVVGYTPWDQPRAWRDPAGLESVLAGGAPPVVVTTSSAGERDATYFFRCAARVLSRLHRRGLLLAGPAAAALGADSGSEVAPGVWAWPYLPMSRVLPHSSLVVHHGGIGSTLATVRFGRACVAIPASFDQWYNAGRIRALRLGRVMEWKQFSEERLAAEIEHVSRTSLYQERATALGQALASEDGASSACAAIEDLINTSVAARR